LDLRDRFSRHRKDNRWIVGGLALLLLILSAIYYFIQESRDLPADLVTNQVLLFILWYVNLTLILTILFVLLRNVFKVLVERHHRILGSKFRTKLVATFIGLSLLPGLLLFVYGSRLLHGWIDRWFDDSAVRSVIGQGYAVSQELNRQIQQTRLRDAARVLEQLRNAEFERPARRPQLGRRLQRLLNELDLDYLALFEETDFVHGVLNPQSGLTDLPEPGERLLVETLLDGQAVRMQSVGGDEGRLVITAVAEPHRTEGSRAVVVTGTLLDPEVAAQIRELIQAYQGYRQLEVRKGEIEAGYLLTFLMVTLLILLASSWVGLYLARRVTVPIQALAEGTKRISGGDLDYRVDVEADDELGVLVESFNSMTGELQRNKELIEESNLELVTANERLAEERAVIGAVLQNVAAGVISVDDEGRILTCNGAALSMLRIGEEALVGRPLSEVWSDPERGKLVEILEQDAGRSGRLVRDVRLLLGGEWKVFETKVSTMRDRQGNVRGRVMVLEDLTELINAQQRAAWSEAARRIAHEIKNPLTPIKLSAERLLKKYQQGGDDLGEILEEGVEIITREVHSMKSMVDEFSRFARMPRPQPTEVDLRQMVEETLSLYQGLKPGVEVRGQIGSNAKKARIDGEQMKRVLINLLDNAIEATEPPGKVTVSVHKLNGRLKIEITDSGKGIPPQAKDKLFLPHFSTKGRGTGLGLSIVHRIVSEHHGTIHAHDNKPQGTVFTIQLPQE
jgi:two-component system nitrogen regulation sensor histidine kinase NtrY